MIKNYIIFVTFLVLFTGCGTSNSKSSNQNNINTNTDYIEIDTPFQCDGREYCSEMDSYAEAKYFLEHCPNVKMDGDKDGIPCERQFTN